MSYTALYRKKRPKTFGELVGQPSVVRTLLNQLNSGQISHAYLFCGTRGTGKTSAARIFARAVNCENPQKGEPCNSCESCRDILAERSLNISEIDAASNNGVENIRDLREEVIYPPSEGRYKVYIIDEVHMLSTSAFNALLKTLEEPPVHAVFLLATTDPQKVPATILSRCQRYDFKRITADDMVETMRGYLKADGAENIEDEALEVIAAQADGAMRDALSILDQALSLYAGETVDAARIYDLIGAADRRVLDDFAFSLAVSDVNRLFEIIDGASRDGRDMAQLTADLIQRLRDLLVEAQLGEPEKIKPEQLTYWLLTLSEALRDLRYAPNPRTALEVAVLRLCSGGESGAYKGGDGEVLELRARVARLESRLEYLDSLPQSEGSSLQPQNQASAQSPTALRPTAPQSSSAPPPSDLPQAAAGRQPSTVPVPLQASPSSPAPQPAQKAPSVAVDSETLKKIKGGWSSFCNDFPPLIRSMLSICGVSQEGEAIVISSDVETSVDYLKSRRKILTEKLIMMFDLPDSLNLAFKVADVYNNITKPEQKKAVPERKKQEETPPEAPWDDDFAAFGQLVESNDDDQMNIF